MRKIGGFRQGITFIAMVDMNGWDILFLGVTRGFNIVDRKHQAYMLILLQKVGVI